MLQSSSGRKWKKCETTLLFIAMNYWGYMSLKVKGRWGLLLPPASSSQRSSKQGLPVLHLGWSTLPQVSSGCARPPSPTTPVLCHDPVRWSPHSGSGGGAPMRVPLQLTSPSSPSRRHLGVLSIYAAANWEATERNTHWNPSMARLCILLFAWCFLWLAEWQSSCSDLIMIFTVSVTLFTVIVAVIYVGTIIIGICYGLYLKCCTRKV